MWYVGWSPNLGSTVSIFVGWLHSQFGVTGSRAIFCISGPSLRSAYIRLPGRRSWKRALVGRRSLCKIAHQRSQCRGVTATATSSGFPFLELIQPAAVRLLGHLIVYGLPRPSVTCSETSSSNGALSIGFQPSSGGPRIEHFLSWRRRSASEAPVRTTASARIDSACTGRAQHPFAPALTSAQ
jgi:hypothetical protein